MAVTMELLAFLVMVVSLDLQCATSQGVPPPPSFTVMVVSPTSIKISWQNVSRYGVNGYKVSYERLTGTMQQGPCPFHGHNETLILDVVDMEYGIILPGLEEFSTYAIHIAARNEVGYSDPSTQKFTTMQAAPSSAPEWLNSTATTSTTITIQWGAVPCVDQNSEITGYKVRYGPVGSSQRATITVGGSASSGGIDTLTGLIPFTDYSIEVAAVDSNGDTGPFSHPILKATTNITSFPENILLEAINATEIHVSWGALELPGWNVSQYTIYYTTVAVPNSQAQPLSEHDVPGNTTSATVVNSNVTPGLIHQFQISGSLKIEGDVIEGPKSETKNITFNLTVTIRVMYDPPADFIRLNPNEYRAASGVVYATCSVQGATGTVSYQWSSTCRHCPFQSTNKPQSTRNELHRGAVHSGDTGTHTCTVNDGSGSAGTASFVMNVVGAGIHVFNPYQPHGSRTNNGLIVSNNVIGQKYRFRFFCRSDSMMENVGELIGVDGTTVTNNSFFHIDNPLPGELTVTNVFDLQTALPASEQGVYTCRIPLESGEQREINIGIYPYRFNTQPNINDCLVLTPGSSSFTLTCTSTGSPATTVTWMRDGQRLTIDKSIYKLIQIVINRARSTYENMLTINGQLNDTLDHTYRCRVTNVLGTTSRELITSTPPVPECLAEGLSPTTIKVSWSRPPECRVGFFRIAWSTALKQSKPCSELIKSGSIDVESDVIEYILTELENFHSYIINITASNSIGSSTCTQNTTTLPAPPSSAPEWVNGTATTSATITIQWGAVPCMDQNSEITGYKVNYGPVGSSQRATDAVSGSASTGGMYTLTGLIPFTNYSIEVAAVNNNGDTGPFTHPYFAETFIPSPANVNFEAVNATAVKVSWTKLQLPHWNLSHYTVYYTTTKQGRAIDQYRTIIEISGNPTTSSAVVVLRNLMPDVVHQFQVSCSLNTERGLVEGPRSMNRRFTFDYEPFQLQIGPVEHCITWQPSKAEKIDAIIRHALTEAISCQCNCSFPHDFIRKGKFSCLNTTTKVSYRSTIVGTTVHNASQLVNFIQKWVSTGPILEVEWWLLHVNANCPVRISSLSDSECQDSRPVACNPTMMAGDPLLFKCVQQSD